ncbi:hypothetical protein BDE02_04G175800 [Populus trichocarpa]|jgi:pentatricopeptide repeat protein|uniref:Uncharacterized protein n=1 Tax=Populus trichocarpa TaxID=3694 RepID=A9PHW8_POPTR|nr:unknown [Populus trichocarpa]KAI5592773.1 hypothetical protein BDE02_04G175800 [Populus trichocarpa]|eukprot:XP_006384846.2 pentatricopeptide repeat-containing protein At2g17210 [Populus trichocarpa]
MRFSAIVSGSKLPNWILRIKESSANGKWQEVVSHYHEIKKAGIQTVDVSVFPPILKAWSFLSHRHGKSLHACLIKQGFDSFTSIGNSIMGFYIRCGDFDIAVDVFNSMRRSRDSVSWNILIHGHLDNGALVAGLWWFTNARVAGFEPNISTMVLVIQACRILGTKHDGLILHGYLIKSGFWAISSVQNSLLSMYVDADMECARELFDEMHEKDVIAWSVMIGGYLQWEEPQVGLQMFRKMVLVPGIEPDGVVMVSVLKACASSRDVCTGRLVHGLVIHRGFDCDLFVENSLIDMYSKCKDAGSAFKVFNEISQRNNVSWNSMLSGFVLNENYSEAQSLISSMRKERVETDEVTLVNILQICKYFVHPFHCKSIHCVMIRRGSEANELVLSALIDAYAKCYLIEIAWEVFARMRRRDVVSWSTMISGFAHCGKPDEAIAVYQEMDRDLVKPNVITIINLLEACSVTAELKRSKWAHGVAIRQGFASEVTVGTAVVDMYSKCGEILASRRAFDQLALKNIVTWSAMIAAYGMNGLAHEALALFAEMKRHGLKPNPVTTLSVLAACSHGGLVEEGLSLFKSMVQELGLEPGFEHYSCMVDMLGRAGKLDTAIEVIKAMPDNLKNGASIWGSLLSACRSYGLTELGKEAISRVLELEPSNSAGYLVASSMYAADGLWDDAARIRVLAKEKGVKVVAGYSLVHIDNKACRFVAGDGSHPRSDEIFSMAQQLHDCIKIDEKKEGNTWLAVIECLT